MPKAEIKIQRGIDWFSLVKENWAWAAPLIYIYVTIVGMIQAWFQFHAFGINVFEFSEINDFLLAAFREPLSFLAIVGVIAYVGIMGIVTKIYEKIKEARSSENILRITASYRLILNFIFVLIVIGAPYVGPYLLNKGYDDRWKRKFCRNQNER